MSTENGGALHLMAQILSSYSSLDEFLATLHRELEAPTQELPRIDLIDSADPAAAQWAEAVNRLGAARHGRHAATN
ncbi:hypothetical protein ACFVUS_24030 [Nocardia sp. NPDC058058]|uniref:hypothetical protein n=1 Tax=Nocardia sp. NPDC058058 TaxID=3346317 RepID=UPI0036D7ED9C